MGETHGTCARCKVYRPLHTLTITSGFNWVCKKVCRG